MRRPFPRQLRAASLSIALGCVLGCGPIDADALGGDRADVAFFDRSVTLAAVRRSGRPAPLLIMMERDPWRAVIGSDSPALALYEDGQVIYRTDKGYRSAKLDASEREALWRQLGTDDLSPLEGRIEATQWTDQPKIDLLVYGTKRPFYISIYGSLTEPDTRSKVPEAVLTAVDRLRTFQVTHAAEWRPEKIEVMIWPYEYAPEASIKWPGSWPSWNDRSSVRRGEGLHSIYLPSAELDRVRALLAQRREKGAVEIGGRKWAASVRLPFPHEELWMPPARD